MKKKVIVAGHACLDITPVFPANAAVSKLGEFLSPGKLVQTEGVDIHAGGAVSNTGLAMKKMGLDVCLMAKTGDDSFGKILAEVYKEYRVEEGMIVQEGESTSYSVILAIPGIDRIFLHDSGCNDTFSLKDIPEDKLEGVSLFHFGYPPVMKKMYENDGDELVAMMRHVKEKGIATSLDLSSVDQNSEAGKADWKKILTRVLPYVDFFVPSIEELCYMLDRPRYEEWSRRAGERDMVRVLRPKEDIKPLADLCMELGAKVLLLKCGAPGLYYKTARKDRLKPLEGSVAMKIEDWCDKEGFECSYVPEKVLSGTGAGDTTIAAFLSAMLQGYSYEMCIHLAAAQGASCVAAYDALSGLKSLSDLEEKIHAGWKKQIR